MRTEKLNAGSYFPEITVKKLGGGAIDLNKTNSPDLWHLVIIYRGMHCPLCTKYLAQLKEMKEDFIMAKCHISVISADTEEKAKVQTIDKLGLDFDIGYDLSIDQMQELGLYISKPRSPQETDRPFSEPGLFVINEHGKLHVVDISNNPFVRPELKPLLSGINWIRNPDNNYPIRGTFEYNH
jgi:peroxiredoxin